MLKGFFALFLVQVAIEIPRPASCSDYDVGDEPSALSVDAADDATMDYELFQEMRRNPLAKNPFFIKNVAARFNAEGSDGLDPEMSGYVCQWLGNLECSDQFELQCLGSGSIDCTQDCPGDESILDDMLAKMQDEKFMSNFPLLQLALKKGQNKASGEEDSNEPDPKEVLIKIIRGCKFVGYDVLLEAMSGPSGVENVKVDEDSVSGFGGELGSEEYQEGGKGGDDYYYGYEEDYDEDFEDEQEELEENLLDETKEGPFTGRLEGKGNRGEVKARSRQSNEPDGPKIRTGGNRNRNSYGRMADSEGEGNNQGTNKYNNRLHRRQKSRRDSHGGERDQDDQQPSSPVQKESRRQKRSTPDFWKALLLSDLKNEVASLKAGIRRALRHETTGPEGTVERKARAHKFQHRSHNKPWTNATEIRKGKDNRRGLRKRVGRKKKEGPQQGEEMEDFLLHYVAGLNSEKRRVVRSLIMNSTLGEETPGVEEMDNASCKVFNMSCVKFPTTQQCTGIAVGGCLSRTQVFAMLFSPRAIAVVITVIVIILVGVIMAVYYLYKKNRSNMMVGPSDEDDEDDYEFGGGDGGGGGGGGGINKMPGSGLDAHMASQVPPPTALDRPEDLAAPGVMDAADIPMETAAAVAPKEPMNRRHNGILTHMSNTQQQVE